MEVNLYVSMEAMKNLNWAAQIALKNSMAGEAADIEDLRELIIPFVVDGNNKPLDETAARRLLGRVKDKDLPRIGEAFTKAMRDFLSRQRSEPQSLVLSRALAEAEDALNGVTQSSLPKSGDVPPGK
jgi:hypothetical protein